MATVFIEGFDHVNTNANAQLKNWLFNLPTGSRAATATFITGRLSGQALRLTTGNGVVGPINCSAVKELSSTYSTLTAGFAFRWDISQVDSAIFGFQVSGGASNVAVVTFLNSTHQLQITNSSNTVIATGTTALVANTWYYVEVKIVVAGASGTCELHLNGVSGEIASTTGNFGSTNMGRIFFQCSGPANNAGFHYDWDDVYVVSSSGSARTTFLGDNRVETLYPVSDGSNLAWTPNSGTNHFDRVNQVIPDADTTYISDSVAGDRDTFGCNSLATLIGTVNGVQTNLLARKDDAAARQIAPVIRKSGTNYDGTTTGGLTSTYLYYSQVYDQDPTSTDWTIATVNACEYGVKEVL